MKKFVFIWAIGCSCNLMSMHSEKKSCPVNINQQKNSIPMPAGISQSWPSSSIAKDPFFNIPISQRKQFFENKIKQFSQESHPLKIENRSKSLKNLPVAGGHKRKKSNSFSDFNKVKDASDQPCNISHKKNLNKEESGFDTFKLKKEKQKRATLNLEYMKEIKQTEEYLKSLRLSHRENDKDLKTVVGALKTKEIKRRKSFKN